MPKVFISHSTQDRNFVEREIVSLLAEHGIGTWYSADSIRTADRWERSILQGLQECDWFLIVLSPHSAQSEWVKDELSWAIERRQGRLIPVLLADCAPEDFHLRLSRIQHVDFRANLPEARKRLLAVLRGGEGPAGAAAGGAEEDSDLTGLARRFEARGGFAPHQAARLVCRLAEVVGQGHRLRPPVVSRNLRPANVLVRRLPEGKLTLCVAGPGGGSDAGAPSPWASPQQRRGEPPDPRDDVYALGVMWYQLVTNTLGAEPPDAAAAAAVLRRRGLGDREALLLTSCLQPGAENRPADAAVLAGQLAPFTAAQKTQGPAAATACTAGSPVSGPSTTEVRAFCDLLAQSRLCSQEAVGRLFQGWQEQSGSSTAGVEPFLRWLVARGHLTEYQAGLLGRGQAEGLVLGSYRILNRVGEGRMAGVYRAAHEGGQVVALKVLPPGRARNPQVLARFRRECRIARRLRHPNVIRTFEAGEIKGLHFLVMEFLEGETLKEMLDRRGALPVAEGVRLLYQALLGLQHIHEQGLVHRDLNPANLMVVAPATVKVLDIGLGRALFDPGEEPGPAGVEGGSGTLQMTEPGDLLGTPAYMAPEQARDARAADIRSDVYSLGCVLYHLLAGQPPFPDENVVRQLVRHATEAPRPLRDFSQGVRPELQQVVERMLAKDPVRRYPTPQGAAQALEPFL